MMFFLKYRPISDGNTPKAKDTVIKRKEHDFHVKSYGSDTIELFFFCFYNHNITYILYYIWYLP